MRSQLHHGLYFPTEEEAQGFVTIDAIADWVSLNVLVIPDNRKTDWSFRKHTPQSGTAPTSHYQGSCQSRERTTLCPSRSCANWGWFGALLVTS